MAKIIVKVIVIAIAMTLSLSMTPLYAQDSNLVGMWQAENNQMVGPNSGKIFLPNGQMYGYNLVPGYSDSLSTWIMGSYQVFAPGKYAEDLVFHTAINYQGHLDMSYRIEDDGQLLSTEYVVLLPNGQSQTVKEQWRRKELTQDRITFLTKNWDILLTQARKLYGRLPAEGQTIEAAADSLKKISDQYKEANNLDGAINYLMVRAELDSTNLGWQDDALAFFAEVKAAPFFANKYANRTVRLSEAQAVTPTDTLILNAYQARAFIYMLQNNTPAALRDIDHAIELVEQSGQQQDYGNLWQFKSLLYFKEGKHIEMGDCALQAVKWMKHSTKFSRSQLADAYYFAVAAMLIQEKWAETIEYAEQVLPLYDSLPNKQNEINSIIYTAYTNLLQNEQNNKQLKKAFQTFIEDKMACAKYQSAANNPWGLEGSYYIIENADWNMDSPLPKAPQSKSSRMLLFKEGSFTELTKEADADWQGEFTIVTVSKNWKNNIRKEWKEYKKKNK